MGKSLGPVGRHPIVDLWNDSAGSLRQTILEALESVPWVAIDILRIGYNGNRESEEKFDQPITLLISVVPESTQWSQGHPVVMRCRTILQQHGIYDIHCEMKESRVSWSAASPPVAPSTALPLLSLPLAHPYETPASLSESLGTSMSAFDIPTRSGTKCLYLRERVTGRMLALTCRHVIFEDAAPNVEYRYQDPEPRRTVVQPSDRGLQNMKTLVANDMEFRMRTDMKTLKAVKQDLGRLNDLASRIFGHVIFSPTFSVRRSESGKQRLRDWALIELHPGKHQSPLHLLENRVKFRNEELPKFRDAEYEMPKPNVDQMVSLLDLDSSTLQLQGTIPEQEMRRPNESTKADDPTILVASQGAESGLVIGLSNSVTSITRRPHLNSEYISEEWAVLGIRRKKASTRDDFSEGGDSGACVWDSQGRIGGMLTGGCHDGTAGVNDVTYVTPIEWLLEDIREHGFDVEIV